MCLAVERNLEGIAAHIMFCRAGDVIRLESQSANDAHVRPAPYFKVLHNNSPRLTFLPNLTVILHHFATPISHRQFVHGNKLLFFVPVIPIHATLIRRPSQNRRGSASPAARSTGDTPLRLQIQPEDRLGALTTPRHGVRGQIPGRSATTEPLLGSEAAAVQRDADRRKRAEKTEEEVAKGLGQFRQHDEPETKA